MILMAAVGNDHHRIEKHSSDHPAPAPLPSSRTRVLHGFSFPTLSWGTHRLLRCTNTGTASAPAPAAPETPSPDQEKKPHRPEDGGGGVSSLRRQRAHRRPWNLRARRSATAARRTRPAGSDGAHDEAAEPAPASAAAAVSEKRGFDIALSRQEIAEDFAAIRGTRPPRRPKKRPRAVQRQVDLLYPGLCLADVTPGSYKIEER